MNLYLLRHGIAVDRATFQDRDDRLRPLTAEGRRKTARAAKGMKHLELRIGLILSSPLARARETAEIVAKELGVRSPRFSELLAPDADEAELLRHLAGLRRPADVLLVGHEPVLGALAARLTGAGPPRFIRLRKGALCLISVETLRPRPRGRLEWLLTAKQLGRI
jgi:phosphohistidine phosphatase